ncbi:uncharacterized protein LOC113444948 [Pseudonaja textilis]|uniref:uncharacterized protein LOC113444948 n=1 Tax=Pseudonaja textilis TaxID=8673 RepID=UPI000EAA3285|nr:uncharacterized protein LOC113444948 [Pseudonaja textilis]
MVLFKGSLTWIILLSWLKDLGGRSFLIQNVRLQKCIHASPPHKAERVRLSECKAHSPEYQWSWDGMASAVVNQYTRECLTIYDAEELAVAQLSPCEEEEEEEEEALQAWSCSKKGHLTLRGRGLHLSAKLGGHSAFLSREKGRFGKWQTGTGSIICATELAGAAGLSEPREASLDNLEEGPKNKTVGSLEIHTPSAQATTFLMIHSESQSYVPSGFPVSDERHREADNETYPPHQKHQEKATSPPNLGPIWRTTLLVLGPLAFILAIIILKFNIQSKKKKNLLALKSRQMSGEGHQPSPGTVSPASKMQAIPASPSPSLKHGEILIEWKDGTTTSLFDHLY